MCIIDVNVARVHHSYDVSAGQRNDEVTDAVVKATNIKQLSKGADVDESNDAVLAQHSQYLHSRCGVLFSQ